MSIRSGAPAKYDHCFFVPNEIFCLGLSASEIAVYCYLLYCEDRETYTCYPKYRTIGGAVGLSKTTVAKCVRNLEDAGLIWTEHSAATDKNGRRGNGSLLYHIEPIDRAVRMYHNYQMRRAEEENAHISAVKKYARKHPVSGDAGAS